MKINCLILILAFASINLTGQTMKWIPINQGDVVGKCSCATTKSNKYQCYILEYIPAATGVMTSYTTGFLVSCTTMGSPIVKNQACSLTPNNRLLDACSELNQVLVNSSGNSGSVTTSRVEAGKPILLHQVCFTIPEGQSITISEDVNTDLTTSIDLDGGSYVTEFPAYESQKVSRLRLDADRPNSWLDFKTTAAGDLIAKLDWTVKFVDAGTHFVVEHSTDGINFTKIGDVVEPDAVTSTLKAYQFLAAGVRGDNYYRLAFTKDTGAPDYSPIRKVNFGDVPFSVEFSPNPATNYLDVKVKGLTGKYEIRLTNSSGSLALEQKHDVLTSEVRLNVDGFPAGVYTLQVKCGDDIFTEKVAFTGR